MPSALAPRYKPVGLDPPPQAQHISFEVKSSSSWLPHDAWLTTYGKQRLGIKSVHCSPNGEGGNQHVLVMSDPQVQPEAQSV